MSALRFDVDAFLRAYDKLDAALVAKGFPPTSPWWRTELERFLRSGRRRWVLRVGRRGGKSSTLCRIVVCWALRGCWSVPPGDVGVIPFVSVDRTEASARIRTIGEILKALGVAFNGGAEQIELTDRRCVFQVRTCSLTGTIGFTAIALVADEMAVWESRDTAANPAEAVMGALRPTTATQEFAPEFSSSSAWGTDDYHYEMVEEGTNAYQFVSKAKTWEANPTISEARTHELEPKIRVWSRAYNNEPDSQVAGAFLLPEKIERSYTNRIPAWFEKVGSAAALFDAADGHEGNDNCAWAIIQKYAENPLEAFQLVKASNENGCAIKISDITGRPIRRADRPEREPIWYVEYCDLLTPPFFDTWKPSRIAKKVAFDGARFGVTRVHADQWAQAAFSEHFHNEGLRFHCHPLTQTSKPAACAILRQWLDSEVLLVNPNSPGAAVLRREMEHYQETMRPGGTMTYSAPRNEHDDLVGAILQGCLASQIDPRSTDPKARASRLGFQAVRGVITEFRKER